MYGKICFPSQEATFVITKKETGKEYVDTATGNTLKTATNITATSPRPPMTPSIYG